MTDIVCVSNVGVGRSVGRADTSWIERVKGVIPYSGKTFLFVDQLESTLKIKFDNFVRVLYFDPCPCI